MRRISYQRNGPLLSCCICTERCIAERKAIDLGWGWCWVAVYMRFATIASMSMTERPATWHATFLRPGKQHLVAFRMGVKDWRNRIVSSGLLKIGRYRRFGRRCLHGSSISRWRWTAMACCICRDGLRSEQKGRERRQLYKIRPCQVQASVLSLHYDSLSANATSKERRATGV